MNSFHRSSRRKFIKAGGIVIASSMIATAGKLLANEEEKKDNEISPPEDLMREHGVLKRILLVYGEALRRMDANEDLPPEPIAQSAKIIRDFVEDYHEKLEENFLFPRFKKAKRLTDLVEVLLQQHQGGRRLTDITLQFATNQALKNPGDRRKLADSMRQFIRMYNPHEAREDTVLFPAFRGIVSAHEFDSLGEDFEKKEDELFGDDGFEKWSTRLRRSKRNSASTIWHSSRQRYDHGRLIAGLYKRPGSTWPKSTTAGKRKPPPASLGRGLRFNYQPRLLCAAA